MANHLDDTINDRSYLYGRALAYFDHIEQKALWLTEQERTTNAWRLMPTYFARPGDTAGHLQLKITPYVARLGKTGYWMKNQLLAILARIDTTKPQAPLDKAMALLGYAAQMDVLTQRKKKDDETAETSAE